MRTKRPIACIAMALAAIGSYDAPDEEVRTDIFLALGEVRARAGDLDGARATYLQAADAASRTGAGGTARHLPRSAMEAVSRGRGLGRTSC